ncbi:MAG: formate dehydrogenase accessory protein FdhE [Candidatus Eisenbacteria sp.]|nr:formate dehydrogenase accessory protein FdhE [Candidatus Eisenbacteria bacterium]
MDGPEVPRPNLTALLERPGISPDLVTLEEALLSYRRTLHAEIGSRYPDWMPESERLAEALRAGTPLVRLIDPQPPAPLLASAARRLFAAIEPHLPRAKELRSWLTEADATGEDPDLAPWFTAAWQDDRAALGRMGERKEIDVDLLHWSGRQLCRPFLHLLARDLRDHPVLQADGERALAAGCPACGGAARLGRYYGDEGHRSLWCDLCDLEWSFPRITCPFCLNQDHEQLGFLAVEDTRGVRIDVCESCHGYLRAVDQRETGVEAAVDFLCEDVGTASLSVAAEREGYRPGSITPRAGAAPSAPG